MDATLATERNTATPGRILPKGIGCFSRGESELRCRPGALAILSTHYETRIIRVLSRAADICLDWKVEILGSPLWCVDARTNLPALTNLALVKDSQLFSLETDDMELSLTEEQDG
ncbi:hypothetical protein [Burkholderia sp. LMG 21824]|uniref:hypothetical protein n=1 Tax=Burkholderia sp. LMG 21824 TaxID=3158172 RepID=UPI003C2DC878